jgi:hypothetical protein
VLRLIRFAILVVLALIILSLVMAIGSVTTGPLEKAVLGAAIGGVSGFAVLAWGIGMDSRAPRSG